MSRFSTEHDELIVSLRGQMTAEDIGQKIGRSADAVRRRWRNLGLTATKPLNDSQKRKRALVGKSDAELIAEFLSRKPVTKCPPAPACGITAFEMATGFTAQPAPNLSYREKMDQMAKASMARRAA